MKATWTLWSTGEEVEMALFGFTIKGPRRSDKR